MMLKLHNLVDNLRFLEQIEPEPDGIENQERLREMLDLTRLDIEIKVSNIGLYILGIDKEADAVRAEEKRLYDRRKALENRSQWLRSYLLTEMRGSMTEHVRTELCTVHIRRNPPSCEVTDVHALPKEYTWVSIEPDKKSILNNFKINGEILPGCNIITDRESVVIR